VRDFRTRIERTLRLSISFYCSAYNYFTVKVVIVGGGAAGMSAASRVRRLDPNAQVTVLEGTKMVSHAPCGIPYFIEGFFNDESLFMAYTPQFFLESRKINVVTEVRVDEIDTGSRMVEGNGKQGRIREDYDYLVYATGALPKIPQVPGVEGENVFEIHHPAHASEIRKRLWGKSRVAVVGGGVLGLEMVEALSNVGKKVIMIHRSARLLNRITDEDVSSIVEREVRGKGVEVRLGEELEEIRNNGRLVVTSGGKYEVDAVVVATGVTPNVNLVKEKLRIGETGAVWTDRKMKTSNPYVYAAGDAAESTNLITGRPDWEPFGPVANKMGYVAGTNIAGSSMTFPGVAGSVITKFYDVFVGKTGLTENEAKRAGLNPVSSFIRTRSRARYYPGGSEIYLKLIAESSTLRLLGAQIVGREEVLGRINVIASLLLKRGIVEDLFFTELGYLPAISQVWDPLVIAARKLMRGD
jgi:NADPH-dependent 2,4-dienoyl-CoA reductase/sulfur reductase-like enzyme